MTIRRPSKINEKKKKTKISVGVLFGGKSSEHQISLLSASNIIRAIPKDTYRIVPIGINKQGTLFHFKKKNFILHPTDPKKIRLADGGESVSFGFGKSRRLVYLKTKKQGPKLDILFPVLHGVFGEDGTIQGLAELADIPYVGCGVLGSAIGMDKDVTKRLLRDAQIPVADFLTLHSHERSDIRFSSMKQKFGLPFFVKPAVAGSSVGVHKVRSQKEFHAAIDDAFSQCSKILIERMVVGKEIECAVLGNEHPIASLPGEVIPQHDFYSYEAKYLDENGALFHIPVKLSTATIKKIQTVVAKTYQVLECSGMARVDGFLQSDGNFILNEINTIPGFTSISMYPKLWEVSGLNYTDLIDRLIQLALKRAP